jgi:hypothetical protein
MLTDRYNVKEKKRKVRRLYDVCQFALRRRRLLLSLSLAFVRLDASSYIYIVAWLRLANVVQ